MDSKAVERLNRFNRIIDSVDNFYHRIALGAGISDSAFWILYMVKSLGNGCRQKDISEACATSKKTINSAIWKLEKSGLIRLEHGSRRDMHIFFTETGEEFAQKHIAPVIEAERASFSRLTDGQQEQLIRLTKKYYAGMADFFGFGAAEP